MALGEEESFAVDTWRIVLLFVAILAIDTGWEWIEHVIDRSIRTRRSSKGLLHAWQQLKFEIMTLGLISLILVAVEEYLLKICISAGNSEHDVGPASTGTSSRRRLLAPKADCPEGKEPLWSSALIHKAHILIFLIGASHVLYALTSLAFSSIAMRRYYRMEERARGSSLLPLPIQQLQREGEHDFVFFLHYLTEEFAKVVKLEFLMWLLAIIWLIFPAGSYVSFWMTGLFLVLSIGAGGKLHVVAMHLARHAYMLYYHESSAGSSDGSPRHSLGPQSAAPSIELASQYPVAPSVEGHTHEEPGGEPPKNPLFDDGMRAHPEALNGLLRRDGARLKERPAVVLLHIHGAIADGQKGRASSVEAASDTSVSPQSTAPHPVVSSKRGCWQSLPSKNEDVIFSGAIATSEGARSTTATVGAIVLLVIDLVLLAHAAAYVMPVYALTATSVNFGTQDGLLGFAKRRGIEPRLIEFLEDTRAEDIPQKRSNHRALVPDLTQILVPSHSRARVQGVRNLSPTSSEHLAAPILVDTGSDHTSSAPPSLRRVSSKSSVWTLARKSASSSSHATPRPGLLRVSCPTTRPHVPARPRATSNGTSVAIAPASLSRLSSAVLQGGPASEEVLNQLMGVRAGNTDSSRGQPSVEGLVQSMVQRRVRDMQLAKAQALKRVSAPMQVGQASGPALPAPPLPSARGGPPMIESHIEEEDHATH